jgi:hypothetical protein
VSLSPAIADVVLWIPVGGVLGYFLFRRAITRRIARMLENALASKLPADQWPRTKAYIAGHELRLYALAIGGGAIVGAGIGSLAFLLK